MLLLALIACTRPPEAPEDLDALCGWLFAEHEDAEAVEAGLVNLGLWLAQSGADAAEGLELTGLTADEVAELDDRSHAVDGILGVAVAFASAHPVAAWEAALLVEDQGAILPDHYAAYERTWETDLDCFLDGACDRALSHEEVVARLALGMTATNATTNAYLRSGEAVVQRSWLPEPGETSVPGWTITDQYYLNALLPRPGGAWRLQATWMVHDQGLLTEAGLLDLSADEMASLAADTEAWLD